MLGLRQHQIMYGLHQKIVEQTQQLIVFSYIHIHPRERDIFETIQNQPVVAVPKNKHTQQTAWHLLSLEPVTVQGTIYKH